MTTIVGVLHITSAVNTASSNTTPATAILSHISDLYPIQTHQSFHLDHRLFVSTSSLLPHAESKRTFTHIFTSSHSPQKTYIGTTSPPSTGAVTDTNAKQNGSNLSTISVPTSSSLEPFTALLTQKLQPQWAPRQFVLTDNGATYTLPLADDARWRISAADVRTAPSRVPGSTGAQSRGVVIEIQYEAAESVGSANLENDEVKKRYETLFRGLLKGLFKNLKLELKLDDAKLYLAKVPNSESDKIDGGQTTSHKGKQRQQSQSGKPLGFELAELYMEVLRGSRG